MMTDESRDILIMDIYDAERRFRRIHSGYADHAQMGGAVARKELDSSTDAGKGDNQGVAAEATASSEALKGGMG